MSGEITPVTFDVTQLGNAPVASAANAQKTVFDIAQFQQAYAEAGGAHAAQADNKAMPVAAGDNASDGFRAVLNTLNSLNGRVDQLDSTSRVATASGDMTAGDMLMLTVRCHEFLFHCELTSNVANRTSDGVQQLFRQQS